MIKRALAAFMLLRLTLAASGVIPSMSVVSKSSSLKCAKKTCRAWSSAFDSKQKIKKTTKIFVKIPQNLVVSTNLSSNSGAIKCASTGRWDIVSCRNPSALVCSHFSSNQPAGHTLLTQSNLLRARRRMASVVLNCWRPSFR